MVDNVVEQAVPVYRYFTTDLITNVVLAEIPFTGVSYERAIKGAGGFSGSIPVIPKTESMDIYNSTMPGRTGLYIVRDGVCVWGGIIWSRSYNAVSRTLSVSGNEFTSYFYHRNIWKTWTHEYGATVVVAGGVGTVTLDYGSVYAFSAGSSARLVFNEVADFDYNGYYTILPNPTPTGFTFNAGSIPAGTYPLTTVVVRVDTYDYIRQLLDSTMLDFSGIGFPNSEIQPGVSDEVPISSRSLTNNVVTITTQYSHSLSPGQDVEITNLGTTFNGIFTVLDTPTDTTFTYSRTSPNVTSSSVSVTTRTITSKQVTSDVATLTTSGTHGFSVGQTVVVSGVDSPTATSYIFDGKFDILSVTSNTFSYSVVGDDVAPTAVTGGTATVTPAALISTYGPYVANSDIQIDYSTNDYSGVNVINKTYRGYELRSVGEELDAYSDNLKGFEYRVDCTFEPDTNSFSRTFVLMPIDFPNPPAPGEVSPISRFGADKLVFEYPGNIVDFSVDESSDQAATRFWVVGSLGGIGEDVSQPYAAATATDLLAQGWPILEQEHTLTDSINDVNTVNNGQYINVEDESVLYSYAERYLNESRPPIADFKIQVNGSLDPQVGTYAPGDWCSIVSSDPFIQMRLASDLEPRSTVIVRKIEKVKVTVPDYPSFPEKVELDLIAEWLVDKIG